MREILFLAHRIPYPPNKGDKVRSFHLLTHLARRWRVHLGTFIDCAEDWDHVGRVRALCGESCFVGLGPVRARLTSLGGLLRKRPLTLPYYRSRKLASWVERLRETRPLEAVLVFSSAMGQYVRGEQWADVQRVIDFVDVDSRKWAEYAAASVWPMSWLYRRESSLLAEFDRELASRCAASVFVSEPEAALFRNLAPDAADTVVSIPNGVDAAYFDPAHGGTSPFREDERVLVFTGAMDYRANVDAVQWFATSVFPLVRVQVPRASFYIVGARPVRAVRRLAELPGVRVTGTVPDVRPYLAHACAAVAPLRVARGIQNKVLEAMAMARPVLATPPALEGIVGWPADAVSIARDETELAAGALELVRESADPRRHRAREFVLASFDWSDKLAAMDRLLEHATASQIARAASEQVASSG